MAEPNHPASAPASVAVGGGDVEALKDLERRNRDAGAAGYLDSLEHKRGHFQMRAEESTILRYLSPRADERIMDVGSGVGRFAMLVAPRVRELLCVDISPASLELLQQRARASGITNIQTLAGDLCKVSLPSTPFDKAFSIEVIQHIPSHAERVLALRKVHDVLRPGGQFLMTVIAWNTRNRVDGLQKEGFWGEDDRKLYRMYFEPSDLRQLMADAGFIDVHLHGVIVLPRRITDKLPVSLSALETVASGLPGSAGIGRDLLAVGRRRS